MERERLAAEFDADMRSILERERELGWCSTRFASMIAQHGGFETAHRLLQPDREVGAQFATLRNLNRMYLSMEYYVVMDKYRQEFSDEERAIARFRMDYGD